VKVKPKAGFTNLVGKSLRRVVYDHRLGEIPPKDVQIFDVVALDAYAVLTKQSMPEIPGEILTLNIIQLENSDTFVPITPP